MENRSESEACSCSRSSDESGSYEGCNSIVCCQHGRPCVALNKSRKAQASAAASKTALEIIEATDQLRLMAENNIRKITEKKERQRTQSSVSETTDSEKASWIGYVVDSDDFSLRSEQLRSDLSTTTSISNASNDSNVLNDDESLKELMSYYLGSCDFMTAETKTERPTEFNLYHQLKHVRDIDELEEQLDLVLVYHTSVDSYRHYPIKSLNHDGHVYYYIESGNRKRVRYHPSLINLIRFYKIYSLVHERNFQKVVDCFPWWDE